MVTVSIDITENGKLLREVLHTDNLEHSSPKTIQPVTTDAGVRKNEKCLKSAGSFVKDRLSELRGFLWHQCLVHFQRSPK